MLDIAAETASAPLDVDAIAQLQAMKMGALLLKFSVEAGAGIVGACGSSGDAPRSVALAKRSGAAFQVADDILDAESYV